MRTLRPPKAWLLLAAGDDRAYGGNTGYDDEVDAHYSWDNTVKNHAAVVAGDFVALWNKQGLLGVSVIEVVDTDLGAKVVRRCPQCVRTNISVRSRRDPKYRCQRCKAEFDSPRTEVKPVTTFESRHDAAWTALDGLLSASELRQLCLSPGSIHSMRELNWQSFAEALVARGADHALARVFDRSPDMVHPIHRGIIMEFPQGHNTALVRVRRGQSAFRAGLLKDLGERCAFTGRTPDRVLEAGHLYSYAELGVHYPHGGLLLRRDIHRLFDDGGLAVEPGSLKINVADELESYPQYARLHDRELKVQVDHGHVAWLEKHWAEHRE